MEFYLILQSSSQSHYPGRHGHCLPIAPAYLYHVHMVGQNFKVQDPSLTFKFQLFNSHILLYGVNTTDALSILNSFLDIPLQHLLFLRHTNQLTSVFLHFLTWCFSWDSYQIFSFQNWLIIQPFPLSPRWSFNSSSHELGNVMSSEKTTFLVSYIWTTQFLCTHCISYAFSHNEANSNTARGKRRCSLAYDHWISMTPASWVYIHHNSAFCTNTTHQFVPQHQDAPEWIRTQRRFAYNCSSMMSSLCHSLLCSATIFAARIW